MSNYRDERKPSINMLSFPITGTEFRQQEQSTRATRGSKHARNTAQGQSNDRRSSFGRRIGMSDDLQGSGGVVDGVRTEGEDRAVEEVEHRHALPLPSAKHPARI